MFKVCIHNNNFFVNKVITKTFKNQFEKVDIILGQFIVSYH